jgi:hypothetical protein
MRRAPRETRLCVVCGAPVRRRVSKFEGHVVTCSWAHRSQYAAQQWQAQPAATRRGRHKPRFPAP